ncbi:hypothetical protein Agub_g13134 [Astrephomene gubernaculifera]|uniref:Ion transport domain-containing protein n=1 Tax=Astrephomene gubernaculifera TaxID=47775 RepID=A0AAD3E3V3_9CHLO|nr:hypothetical protein Agub_g13134 [Astrephomene gubernaculifera]
MAQGRPTPNAPAPATLHDIKIGGNTVGEAAFTPDVHSGISQRIDSVHGVLQRDPGVCQDEARFESRTQISDHRVSTEHAAPGSEAQTTPFLHKFGLQELLIPRHGLVEPERVFAFPASRVCSWNAPPIQLWESTPTLFLEWSRPFGAFYGHEVYSFTAFQDHYSVHDPEYLEVTFTEQVQLYVLLEAGSKIPKWLPREFRCLPEDVALASRDSFSLRRPEFSLVIWQRNHQCMPGVRYVLGAPQGRQGRGYTYLLAWRKLGEGEEVEEPPRRMSLEYEGPQHYPEGMTGGRCTERPVRAAYQHTESPSEEVMLGEVEGHLLDFVQDSIFIYPAVDMLPSLVELYREFVDCIELPFWVTVDGKKQLLTTVAAAKGSRQALMRLVVEGAEIDATAFRYILEKDDSERGTSGLHNDGYFNVQHFVLSYLVRHRNPVAVAMAFAQELTAQGATSNGGKAKKWRELAIKLRTVAVELLGHLDTSIPRKRAETIHAVLHPKSVMKSISEASPLQVAFDTVDLDFMSAPAIQDLMRKRWIAKGQGEDDDLQNFHPQSRPRNLPTPKAAELVEFRATFQGYFDAPFGVVDILVEWLISKGLLPANVTNFIDDSHFFDSPQRRWVFKLFLESFFLYVYHHVLLMTDEFRLVWQHVVLVLYIAGMVVDEAQELIYQYHGRIMRYYSNGFNVVEALLVAMLVACFGLKLAMWGLPGGQVNPRWKDICTAKELLYSTASILVWARTLQYLIPLHEGFGSLLMVISQMIREMLKFALPGVVLMFGVAFSFFSVFRSHTSIPELSTFPLVLVQLFRTFVGETMFELMDKEHNQLYNLYGNILAMLFTLMATVVMANLLIALMTYHYKPEQFAKQSRFQAAEQLRHYEYMVERHLLGAPFSLPLLLLSWLPIGILRKRSSLKEEGQPTGFNALPHLVYQLTVHPILLVLIWAVHVAMTPWCIVYLPFCEYRYMTRDSMPTPAAQEQNWIRALARRLGWLPFPAWCLATLPFWLVFGLAYYAVELAVVVPVIGIRLYADKVAGIILSILDGWELGRISTICKRDNRKPAVPSDGSSKLSTDPSGSHSGSVSVPVPAVFDDYIPGHDARRHGPERTRWRVSPSASLAEEPAVPSDGSSKLSTDPSGSHSGSVSVPVPAVFDDYIPGHDARRHGPERTRWRVSPSASLAEEVCL